MLIFFEDFSPEPEASFTFAQGPSFPPAVSIHPKVSAGSFNAD